ncbi:MAG TPA: DUF6111 family protein [Hyphomicrobiaceae bacterium]|jgi:hypothetical protein|nr:DUF6111 family protein [Hyphomicrobiaceae bacterium]
MRIVIENVLLFLLPTLVYVAYVVLMRRGASSAGTVLNEAPLIWLFIVGAVIVGATLAYYATTTPGGKPGDLYIPPHMEDGHIAPGRLK